MIKYLLILLFPIGCYAQVTIKGTVKSNTGNPLFSATIILSDTVSDNSIIGYAISDNNGNYEIKYKSIIKKLT